MESYGSFLKEKGYSVFSKFESVLTQCMKFSTHSIINMSCPSPGWVGGFSKSNPSHCFFPISLTPPTLFGDRFQKPSLQKQVYKRLQQFFSKVFVEVFISISRTRRDCPKEALRVIPGRAKRVQGGFFNPPQKSGCF